MRSLLVAMLLLGAALPALLAQGNFGSVTGTVTDQSGATVAGSQVELRNIATGLQLTTMTSSAGIYLIPNAPNGEYRLVVSAASFKTFQRQPVIVLTSTATTVDVALEVGAVSDRVNVDEASTQLEASTSSVGAVLTEKAYKQLPLDITGMDTGASGIRQPQQFIFMVPGVTGTSYEQRINGGQTNSQSIQIDGHNWMLTNNPGRLVSIPPPFEAIEEFKLNTAQYNAESPAGHGGTQFTFKSGTDQFHGGLFHLTRNDFLNARGFFANTVSPLKLNESAISIGGPVILPRYRGAHRTHFNGTLTRFSRRGINNAASLITVPTAAFKQGDFRQWADARGAQIPIFDPATTRADGNGGFVRDPFPSNIIPGARIGKVGRNAAALMPDPERPGTQNNRIIVASSQDNRWLYSLKVDHAWTPNQITRVTSWGMYNNVVTISGYPGIRAPDDKSSGEAARNILVSHTSVISPSLVNEARFGLAPWQPYSTGNSGLYLQSGTEVLGIPNLPSAPGITPRLSIANMNFVLGNGNRQVSTNARQTYSFGDSISWVRGRSQWKFGFTAMRSRGRGLAALNRMGTFNFDNRSTSQPDSPNVGAWGQGFASFLLGEVYSANRLINDNEDNEREQQYQLYAQNNYKVSRRLTLNLGIT